MRTLRRTFIGGVVGAVILDLWCLMFSAAAQDLREVRANQRTGAVIGGVLGLVSSIRIPRRKRGRR